MTDPRQPSEAEHDFGVRLEWPADPIGEPFEPLEPPASADAHGAERPDDAGTAEGGLGHAAGGPANPSMAPALERWGDTGLEGVEALAAIVARVDALSAVITTFRNLISNRLSEAEVRWSGGLQQHVEAQGRAAAETRHALSDLSDDVRRLMGAVDAVTGELATHQADVRSALTALADDIRVMRRRTTVRARPAEPEQAKEIADAIVEALRSERVTEPGPASTPAARKRRAAGTP